MDSTNRERFWCPKWVKPGERPLQHKASSTRLPSGWFCYFFLPQLQVAWREAGLGVEHLWSMRLRVPVCGGSVSRGVCHMGGTQGSWGELWAVPSQEG